VYKSSHKVVCPYTTIQIATDHTAWGVKLPHHETKCTRQYSPIQLLLHVTAQISGQTLFIFRGVCKTLIPHLSW